MRMSVNKAQIHANNWFYSMTWVGGTTTSGALSGGGQVSFACCLLFVWIYRSQNALHAASP